MNTLFVMPFAAIFFWLAIEHIDTVAWPRVARLALAMVLLMPIAAFAADAPKPAELSKDSKISCSAALLHEAQLRLMIDKQQEALANLQSQLNQVTAAWPAVKAAAFKADGIDAAAHDVTLNPQTGNVELVTVATPVPEKPATPESKKAPEAKP